MKRRLFSSLVLVPIVFVVLAFTLGSLLVSREAGIMEASATPFERSGKTAAVKIQNKLAAKAQTEDQARNQKQTEAQGQFTLEEQLHGQDQASSVASSSASLGQAPSGLDSDKTKVRAQALSASAPAVMPKSDQAEKIVYLTFDDGPSKLTDQVLDILKKEDIPATFFVLGEHAKRMPEVITRIVEAGHVIGNHTYNHDYSALYQGFSTFWGQIKDTEEVLLGITGARPELIRAPGGTYGHFDQTYFDLLQQAGYKVFDWNIDSGDSKRRGVPASEIIRNSTPKNLSNEVIVLMHDGAGHAETVKALPEVIKFYKKQGYSFRTLSVEQKPVQFQLSNKIKHSGRKAPSRAWIESHIMPNAALFGPGLPLYVEAGGVQTKLDAGEYVWQDGQYQVPLRAVMERLGAQVSWDRANRSAIIAWGDSKIIVDTQQNTITSESEWGTTSSTRSIAITHKNGALWVPLRAILETTGHPIISASSTKDEQRVKAN